jgi:hypothetical protein
MRQPVPPDPRTRDDLLDAMRLGACPLCVLVERIERRAVDMFLYEEVNDIGRRDALRASRGLCLHHTEMLAEGRSALGIAIVSRDILRAMTAELEAVATSDGGWLRVLEGPGPRAAARIEPQAGCPMCAERPRIEAPLILGLLQNLGDEAFAAAYDESGGLCRVHLAATLRAADAATARSLAARQAMVWRRLEALLDEFIRKQDYRYQREPLTGPERDVWRRALQLTSGWYAPRRDD